MGKEHPSSHKKKERFIEIKLGNLKTPCKEFANLYEFMNYMKEEIYIDDRYHTGK